MLTLLTALLPAALAQGLDTGEYAVPGEEAFERDGLFDYEPEYDGPVGETIVVTDEAEVKRRQAELVESLEGLGYEKKRGRDGRTVYVTDTPWEPKVIVDDDGWMIMRRRPVVLTDPDLPDHWWFSDTPVEYLTCVVAPHLCVRLGGLVISPKKLGHKKAAVVMASEDELRAWGDAIADHALSERLYEGLPEELDRIWYEGVTADGLTLGAPEQRRAHILELWISRTDNRWGDAARGAIEAYMEYVIQESPHPYTAAEIEAANARRTCQRALVLPAGEG